MALNIFTEPIRKKSNRGYENRNRTEPWKSWTVPALLKYMNFNLKRHIQIIGFDQILLNYDNLHWICFISRNVHLKPYLSSTFRVIWRRTQPIDTVPTHSSFIACRSLGPGRSWVSSAQTVSENLRLWRSSRENRNQISDASMYVL